MHKKLIGSLVFAFTVAMLGSFTVADAHQDPLNCNASGLQQFPSVAPSGQVYDGTLLTYSVIYSNLDPDGAGATAPCNITDLDATLDLPGGGPVLNVLTDAVLNVGDTITCPGGAGCAPGPYTYTVVHADEAAGVVTANFAVDGILHQSETENIAADNDNLSNNVIHPTTIVSIGSSPTTVTSGGTTTLTITEHNDGDVRLTNAHVVVDQGVGILNSTSTGFSGDDGDGILEPGEIWQWLVTGVVVNASTTWTATGHGIDPLGMDITFPGDPEGQDTASVSVVTPSTIVDISSSLASTTAGGTTTLTVTEQNDGTVPLTNVHVDVDQGIGSLNSSSTGFSGDDGDSVLEPGETWQWIILNVIVSTTTTYTATGFGTDPGGTVITYPGDEEERDAVTVTAIQISFDGCTLGYWKNHLGSWQGFAPTDTLESIFNVPDSLNMDNVTLLQALNFGGGSGDVGAARILLKQAVASLLNSSHSLVDFSLTTAEVIAQTNTALTSGRAAMVSQGGTFGSQNELGCSINAQGLAI